MDVFSENVEFPDLFDANGNQMKDNRKSNPPKYYNLKRSILSSSRK